MKATITYLLMVIAICRVKTDNRLLCASWSSIERALIHEAQQVNCTMSSNCSGIFCSIHQFGYDVKGGLSINSCENPPSLTLNIDVPKLNIKRWERKFVHGDKFSLTETLGGMIDITQENDKYIISLLLDVPSGIKPNSPLLHLIPSFASSTQLHVFQNVIVYVPQCISQNDSIMPTSSTVIPVIAASGNAQGNCSILNSSCTINEMCQQISSQGFEGFCVCVTGYYRSTEGKCVYYPLLTTSTVPPGGDSPQEKGASTKSILLTAIFVPLAVIVIAVSAVYITIRYRVVSRLRRRLRVQVYENVLLGQDEDDDEESLNPVA